MSTEHYFSTSPASPDERITRKVTLRGIDYSVTTAHGVFSHDRVDKGTAVLLARVPEPVLEPGSLAVDLGCGWGPITLALAQVCARTPGVDVWGIDVNERARELTHANLSTAGLTGHVFSPEQALEALGERPIDLLWSNPPVRIGKAELHALLTTWLSRLARTGVAYLVVQRNLGADSLQSWLRSQGWVCDKLGSAKGFRVFEVTHLPEDA